MPHESETGHTANLRRKRRRRLVLLLVLVGAVVLVFVIVVGVIAVPGLLRARRSGNEASAIGSVRSVVSAQAAFSSACGDGRYAPTLPLLGRAPLTGGSAFLDPTLASSDRVERSSYRIWIEATSAPDSPPTCNGAPAGVTARTYLVRAEPLPEAGARYFAATEDGTIYQGSTSIRFADGTPTGDARPLY